MKNLVLTQLSIPELDQRIYETLDRFFAGKQIIVAQPDPDDIGGIELAMAVTGKAKATIYSLASNSQIPHFKRGKKLYFSRKDLIEWLRGGRRKTQSEIALEAENLFPRNPRQLKTVAGR